MVRTLTAQPTEKKEVMSNQKLLNKIKMYPGFNIRRLTALVENTQTVKLACVCCSHRALLAGKKDLTGAFWLSHHTGEANAPRII